MARCFHATHRSGAERNLQKWVLDRESPEYESARLSEAAPLSLKSRERKPGIFRNQPVPGKILGPLKRLKEKRQPRSLARPPKSDRCAGAACSVVTEPVP